jgi:hypothetical protein
MLHERSVKKEGTMTTTYSWNNPITGNWEDVANWTPSGPPAKRATVVIDPANPDGTPFTVRYHSTNTIHGLTIGPLADLQDESTGSLTVIGGSNHGFISLDTDSSGILQFRGHFDNTGSEIVDFAPTPNALQFSGATIKGGSIVFEEIGNVNHAEVLAGLRTKLSRGYLLGNEAGLGIDAGAILALHHEKVGGSAVDQALLGFNSTNGKLAIYGDLRFFNGTIFGLANGGAGSNVIDVATLTFSPALLAESAYVQQDSSHGYLELSNYSQTTAQNIRISLLGQYVGAFNPPAGSAGFKIADDGHGGTLVSYVAPPST